MIKKKVPLRKLMELNYYTSPWIKSKARTCAQCSRFYYRVYSKRFSAYWYCSGTVASMSSLEVHLNILLFWPFLQLLAAQAVTRQLFLVNSYVTVITLTIVFQLSNASAQFVVGLTRRSSKSGPSSLWSWSPRRT